MNNDVINKVKMKALRKQKRMTLAEIAAKVGVSESCVCLYENGKRTPRIDVLLRLSTALGVSATALLTPHHARAVKAAR